MRSPGDESVLGRLARNQELWSLGSAFCIGVTPMLHPILGSGRPPPVQIGFALEVANDAQTDILPHAGGENLTVEGRSLLEPDRECHRRPTEKIRWSAVPAH